MTDPTLGLAPLDWLVLLAYALVVLTIGVLVSRSVRTGKDLFTGGRTTPWWAIAVSVLATAVSGVTFIGGPQQAYFSNITYLSASIATVLGAAIIAWLFLPRFFADGASTVYESIGVRRGLPARRACASAFLVGRLLASGVRLYVAAVPCSMILFGDVHTEHVLISVVTLGVVALLYTSWGGIRAVIWTDLLQACVMVIAVIASMLVLAGEIPMDAGAAINTLRTADPSGDKLRLFDLEFSLTTPFSLWTILLGLTLFNAAAFGTDQDLAQRLLTAPNARRAARSLIVSSIAGIGLTGLFLMVGVMLFLRDHTGGLLESDDTRKVFLTFILSDLPVGLRGLLIAGLFAAAMSSTDSALNAMSSSISLDFRGARPLGARGARISNACCGFALIICAGVFAMLEGGKSQGLIPFALAVMIYAYAGLLAVFSVCFFTSRGTYLSIVCALLAAAFTVAILQFVWEALGAGDAPSFGWRMLAGTVVGMAVCALGTRKDTHGA